MVSELLFKSLVWWYNTSLKDQHIQIREETIEGLSNIDKTMQAETVMNIFGKISETPLFVEAGWWGQRFVWLSLG